MVGKGQINLAMFAKAFCSDGDNTFGGARKDAAAVSNCCCSVMC